MGNFDPIKHGRGFHGRFTEMGLSARALQERFGVKIHGLGAARQRYQVTDKNGANLGHVQRLSDNNFHAVHADGHTHPDGPFPTRAMAGAAVADMHGVFADKYPQAHQSLKRAAFRSGESRIAASVAARRAAERIAAEPVRDRPARGPRKHPDGPEPKAKNGYEYKLVQKEPARIQGTTQVLKKYHVMRNGEKVGEIRHEKYYHQIMEGRLRAGLRHDFTAYQVHEGSSDYPRRVAHGGQAFTLKEAKDAAEKHFDAKSAERAAKEEPPKPSEAIKTMTPEEIEALLRKTASAHPSNDGSRFVAGEKVRVYGKYDAEVLGHDPGKGVIVHMQMARPTHAVRRVSEDQLAMKRIPKPASSEEKKKSMDANLLHDLQQHGPRRLGMAESGAGQRLEQAGKIEPFYEDAVKKYRIVDQPDSGAGVVARLVDVAAKIGAENDAVGRHVGGSFDNTGMMQVVRDGHTYTVLRNPGPGNGYTVQGWGRNLGEAQDGPGVEALMKKPDDVAGLMRPKA